MAAKEEQRSMGLDYVDEKIGIVLNNMVTTYKTETLQDRVFSAAMGTVTLEMRDFPEDLQPKFAEFRKWVRLKEDETQGSFKASADALNDNDAHHVLELFFNLAMEVTERATLERARVRA
jgi:hypothetical protein